MILNADLHVHSKYSGATSKRMNIREMCECAKKKGVQLLGTGDCFQEHWLEGIKALEESRGIFSYDGLNLVLTDEVEDTNRVHHLLLFPSIESAEEMRSELEPYSNTIRIDGRPKLALTGEKIAEIAEKHSVLIGPCHAFTPWTAMYAYFASISDCYRGMADYVSFLELGLSADTDYADRIAELQRLTFLTNSDAHSPNPNRIAREFNRVEMRDLSFSSLADAILRRNGCRIILNVGIPPQEGKYNESACIRCLKHYSLEEAISMKWRCSCGGLIKRGVADRVKELATYEEPEHPAHRPPYLHLIPLSEIIARVLPEKGAFEEWNRLVETFGNEINVLIDVRMDKIRAIARSEVADAIRSFRDGEIRIIPGGGGAYGRIEILRNKKGQKSIMDF
ncbi:MAG: TIGR00375 family protein [Candidatus Thermoplasmatota archaeon]|nr:TIGR00375 family protein [Candidatus Thermoplasmatota archaeon]